MSALSNESFSHYRCAEATLPFSAAWQQLKIGGGYENSFFYEKNKSFCVFAFLALLIILAAIFAPVITGGVSPTDAVLKDALRPPSANHIFGTDKLGRDIFARVIYGARTSLTASFSVVLIIFTLGTVLGVLAGYFGGWVDTIIMRIADMMVSFPGMVFAITVAGVLGASIKNAVIAVSLVSWTKYARLARSLVLKIRNRDYVAAAVVTGSRTPYILKKYMIPNVVPTLVITAATDIGAGAGRPLFFGLRGQKREA